MAIKKSQLYSLLWASCDVLRGSMDASQYKDYVLVILFIKYISDKAKDPSSMINMPEGCSFADMVKLKNKPGIGDAMNTIIRKLADANDLQGIITNADFDDDQKLGKDKDKIETLSRLIAVFENKNLDFSNNRAADDDLIGDAYEYLMRNFASQSGKSKGQFYTPAEVSRVMAKVVGIAEDTRDQITIYDPTCGSGSLLLRARAEARGDVSLEGQEFDNATIGMAKMSMIIHGIPDAELIQGDTLNNPQHKINDTQLMQFDYVVANPPFSKKGWMTSTNENDPYGRWGNMTGLAPVPPDGCGDYAFLLHIVRSLKSNGKAACILPHGVLFRGNAEADIRRFLIERHIISGIIGLPSNIFFGTGIPACLIIINKEAAASSKGIYMIDAKDGFMKDGPKNRLREQDIRRIVDTWRAHEDVPHYARLVSYDEIEKNDFNLNIPRYIEPEDKEIVQNIYAHLHGGLPKYDVEEVLNHLWEACPTLKDKLFQPLNANYYRLAIDETEVTPVIEADESFRRQHERYMAGIKAFAETHRDEMLTLNPGCEPKRLIELWGAELLDALKETDSLVDPYNAYQLLMEYWAEAMQDDCYIISRDGWHVELHPVSVQKVNKKAKTVTFEPKKNPTYADMESELLPVPVVVAKYFAADEQALQEAQARLEEINGKIEELEAEEDYENTPEYKEAKKQEKAAKTEIKALLKRLTDEVVAKYAALTEDEIRHLVVEDKWLATLQSRMEGEMTRVSQEMTTTVLDLQHRYARTLPEIEQSVSDAEKAVKEYLKQMELGAYDLDVAQDLLAGKKRLPGFTEEWIEVTFEEIISRFATGLNPRTNFVLNNGGYLYYVTIKDFKDGVLYFDNCDRIDRAAFELIQKRADLKKGDLLFSSIGRVGDAYVIKEDPKNWNINESVYNLRPNYEKITSDFLYFIIKSRDVYNKLQEAVTGSTLRSIKMSHLKQISFKIPPTLAEQEKIANILLAIDAALIALEQKHDKYIAIKSGMMQDLLTGKIRLV